MCGIRYLWSSRKGGRRLGPSLSGPVWLRRGIPWIKRRWARVGRITAGPVTKRRVGPVTLQGLAKTTSDAVEAAAAVSATTLRLTVATTVVRGTTGRKMVGIILSCSNKSRILSGRRVFMIRTLF